MKPSLLLIVLAAFIFLYGVVALDIPGLWKFFIGLVGMALVSHLLIKYHKLTGEYGLIMLRSKKGISLIHKIAQDNALWKFISDTGIVTSYGLLSLLIMKKHVTVKTFIAGMLLLGILFFFVTPNALWFLSSTLNLNGLMEKSVDSTSSFNSILLLSPILLLIGGFFLFILFGVIMGSLIVLSAVLSSFLGGTDAISNTPPLATLILPGVNLPFVEGVLALGIILVVHEGAHAVLARIAKIPILSSGLVLFGIIPIGAFVEPDEDRLKKLENTSQTRVLVAGSTANFFTSLIFFLLFAAFALANSYFGFSDIALLGPVAGFITMILGLTFALNFIVGSVNLLPVPFFDGYRTLELNVPHKPVMQFLSVITILAFLLNFLPWLFR